MTTNRLWPIRRRPGRPRIRRQRSPALEEFLHPHVPRLSEILENSTHDQPDRMSFGALADRLSARGLAPVVLMLGVLNAFAVIPGLSAILGLPVVFLGISLIAGAQRLWLPARIRDRAFDRKAMDRAIAHALPHIRRVERLARPRLWPTGQEAILYRILGLVVLLIGLLVVLPIPFGNFLPSVTLILLSVGFIERDGLWVLAGLLVAIVAGALIGSFAGLAGFAYARIFG